jgi:hypothetical protein
MIPSPRQLLQYSQVLELFPLALRNRIYAGAEYRDFKPNVHLIKRGDEGTFMVGVMSGRMRMSVRSAEGKEMLITMVDRGELVGEMSVIDEQPRAIDVVTETDCTLMIIKREEFISVLRSSPEAMMGLLKMTCHRMRYYLNTMELISLQKLPVRLGHYLLQLAHDYGTDYEGKIIISAPFNQMDIAHHLACTRESINKQLSAFIDKGLVALDGSNIIILNAQKLKEAISPAGEAD